MTKQEYWDKMENVLLNGCDTWWDGWEAITNEYLETLYEEIAKLQEDNRSLVEQMNAMANRYESLEQHCTALEEDINMWKVSGAMAISPNEEIITWHDYPDEKPDMIDKGGFKNNIVLIKYRYENAPEELVGIDTYWESPYIDGFKSTCDPNVLVLAWAYLPKGATNGAK